MSRAMPQTHLPPCHSRDTVHLEARVHPSSCVAAFAGYLARAMRKAIESKAVGFSGWRLLGN